MGLSNKKGAKLIEIDEPQAFPLLPRRAFLRKGMLTGVGAVGLSLLGSLPAAAAPAGQLQVVGVQSNGGRNPLWHTIRFANGTWVPQFGNINNQEHNGGSLAAFDASCAAAGNNLQVVAADSTGVLWHTIRFADGTWVPQFGNVNNQERNGGSLRFRAVGVA